MFSFDDQKSPYTVDLIEKHLTCTYDAASLCSLEGGNPMAADHHLHGLLFQDGDDFQEAKLPARRLAEKQRTCPRCGSHDVLPSRRRSLSDWMWFLVFRRPWRCHYCTFRFKALL